MKKAIYIALKDLQIVFRDRNGLVLMLVAPLALTLVIYFAFGRSDSTPTLSHIPVILVNHDTGQFSSYFLQAFQSDLLKELVSPTEMKEDLLARQSVDNDNAVAAVIIPEGFSDSIMPAGLDQGDTSGIPSMKQSIVEIYVNPGSPISAGVIRTIVDSLLLDFSAGITGAQVSIGQLVESGRLDPSDLNSMAETLGRRAVQKVLDEKPIRLSVLEKIGGKSIEFSFIKYMAPSMAILYLMFTMSNAGRSILVERERGTLSRVLISPTLPASILGGKILGTFLTGMIQMTFLILAGHWIFGLNWGPFSAVAMLTIALVAAASGWGIVVAALSRSPGQANAIGTAINLTFAALSGNFLPRAAYPIWLQNLGLITPNAWGIDAYYKLITGGASSDAVIPILALLSMAVVLFFISILIFQRQYRTIR